MIFCDERIKNPEKRGIIMTESILHHKKLLIVDDEPDVLEVVEEEILESSPDSKIDKASNYKEAAEFLKSNDYDLVILDIMGVRGYDLLEMAVSRKFKAIMLTAHAMWPEALKKSHDLGASGYLPKDKLGELVPFIEDILQNDYKTAWGQVMRKLDNYFKEQWGNDWREKEVIDW
jgi:DNA-binding NtrC family response regulator